MNPITGQNLLGRSADSKQVRGRKTPNLLPELGKNLIEAHPCGNRKYQFKLNYTEKELSNKRRLILKIYRFHKSLSIYILLSKMYKDFAQFVFFKKLILFFNFCDIMLHYNNSH